MEELKKSIIELINLTNDEELLRLIYKLLIRK